MSTFSDTVEILKKYERIAVVGMSKDPAKPSHSVPMYMKDNGYEIFPVNPTVEEIEGMKSYGSLEDVEEDIEVVNIFRPSRDAEDVVRQAVRRHLDKGDIKAIWLQLGIFSDEARRLAEENGLEYVENKCILVEHAKM